MRSISWYQARRERSFRTSWNSRVWELQQHQKTFRDIYNPAIKYPPRIFEKKDISWKLQGEPTSHGPLFSRSSIARTLVLSLTMSGRELNLEDTCGPPLSRGQSSVCNDTNSFTRSNQIRIRDRAKRWPRRPRTHLQAQQEQPCPRQLEGQDLAWHFRCLVRMHYHRAVQISKGKSGEELYNKSYSSHTIGSMRQSLAHCRYGWRKEDSRENRQGFTPSYFAESSDSRGTILLRRP